MENNKDIFKDSFEEEKQKNDTSHDFLNNINKSKGEGFKEEKFIYQKTSSTKWIIRFAFVLLIGAIAFFLLNQKSTVIDLTGMSGNDALSWGTENNIIVTLLGRYSSDMEEGRVISQSIDPGEKVEKNMNIILEVSEGLDPYGSVSLPEFDASWSKTSIDRWLKQNGIENYTVKYAENEEIKEGFLISYRLIGATKDNFLRSSEIEFVICMSEEEETVIVQDFLNKTLLEADIWAKRNNIEYIYSYEESSIYPEDRIMYQSIDADEEISPAETLILIISSGKSEIVMDDFINKTMAEVDAWAKKVDIAYEQIQLFSSIYPKGRIISQSIPAGDIVDPQSTLIVGISKGERAIVPDFSSVSSDDAVNYSDDLKITVKEIYFPGISNGDYISQSLAPDTEVAVGTDLTVCYSLGSEIYINDFKSKDITELESWIRDVNNMGAELALSVIYEEGTGYAKGKIIDQIPYSEKIPLSSSIEITVSLDSLIKVPDFFSSAEETAV